MPGAGPKTELITFERESRSDTVTGGYTMSWTEIGSAWAEVRYLRGGEKEQGGVMREINAYRFICWSAAVEELALSVRDVIVYNGERYNVREVPRRIAGAPDTEIIAETGVTL